MFTANFHEQVCVPLVTETAHRIRAEQREGPAPCESIPELFQTDRSFGFALFPKQRDHLTVDRDTRISAAVGGRYGLLDHASDDFRKAFVVGPSFDHEGSEGLGSVQG